METSKKCNACRETLPARAFYPHKSNKDGLRGDCKVCQKQAREAAPVTTERRDAEKRRRQKWNTDNPEKAACIARSAHLRRTYGVTLEEYQDFLTAQGGACAICRQPETSVGRGGKIKQLHVDHDHQTGRVRGLLCSYCNTAIGLLREDRETLSAAMKYLSDSE